MAWLALLLALWPVVVSADGPPAASTGKTMVTEAPNPDVPRLCGYSPHVRSFPVTVSEVFDARTLELVVDQGFDTRRIMRAKLVGVGATSRHCDSTLYAKTCKAHLERYANELAYVQAWVKKQVRLDARFVTPKLAYLCAVNECLNYRLVQEMAEYRCGG